MLVSLMVVLSTCPVKQAVKFGVLKWTRCIDPTYKDVVQDQALQSSASLFLLLLSLLVLLLELFQSLSGLPESCLEQSIMAPKF
jgi:hypothetical protein